jgi:hypothetical protein
MGDDSVAREDDADVEPSETVRARYDWRTDDPVAAVIETVCLFADVGPTRLDPLDRHVDTDALEGLVNSAGGSDPDLAITFDWVGYRVTVRGDGEVVVRAQLGR